MPFSLFTVSFKVIYAADRHAKKELKKQVQSEPLNAVVPTVMTQGLKSLVIV
jgi:hypothetical protein